MLAAGAPAGGQAPPVELPRLPEVPKLPAVPKPPAVPTVPSLPGVQAPSSPAPPVSAPTAPSAGGGIGGATNRAAPAGGGGSTAGGGGSTTREAVGGLGAGTTSSGAGARAQDGGAGPVARERKLRRRVRRLAPCLDAVSSLERRVLVLRSGLGRPRPHSRTATARRLGISVRRVTRAERRGLSGISRANRATGCGYGGGGGSFGQGGFAGIAESAPIVAQALGIVPTPRGDREAADPEAPGFPTGALPSPDLEEAVAEGAASAAEEGGPFPFTILLALLAMAAASAAIVRGRRVAGHAFERRAEEARERRHEELVTAVHGILGERQHR
ncbi:MAG TPA: hypothetical protein VHG69_00410 [Thermoleophilaceae bacterium]|nr:hypothetical protein [Thermoleophilaceae bacterium]